MRNFELIFVVADVGEDLEERILADRVNVASMGRMQLAYLDVSAESWVDAGRQAISLLVRHGVRVVRAYLDLVTKSEIADRTGASKTAVGNWVKETDLPYPFPVEYDHGVTGPMWEWGRVNEWLRCTRKKYFDGYSSPDGDQVMWLDQMVLAEREPKLTLDESSTVASSRVGLSEITWVAR